MATLELAEELIVQVISIGQENQRRIIHRRLFDDAACVKELLCELGFQPTLRKPNFAELVIERALDPRIRFRRRAMKRGDFREESIRCAPVLPAARMQTIRRHLPIFLALLALSAPLVAREVPHARPFERFDGCRVEPDEWTDGDSFRVRLPDGRLETFRLYFVDPTESRSRGQRSDDQAAYFDMSRAEAVQLGQETKAFTAAARRELYSEAETTLLLRMDSPATSDHETAEAEAFREQCRRQMARPLEARMKYGFCRVFRPVLDEPGVRSFASTAEYREWCATHLPAYLGFQPAK